MPVAGDTLKRWIGPSLVAVVVMTLYAWLISPEIQRARAMWQFLGANFDAAVVAQQKALHDAAGAQK